MHYKNIQNSLNNFHIFCLYRDNHSAQIVPFSTCWNKTMFLLADLPSHPSGYLAQPLEIPQVEKSKLPNELPGV